MRQKATADSLPEGGWTRGRKGGGIEARRPPSWKKQLFLLRMRLRSIRKRIQGGWRWEWETLRLCRANGCQ